MRILVHDYAGHPFQVQLSRALAARGHDVLHLYSASITTPRGDLQSRETDSCQLRIEPITLKFPIDRRRLARRALQERRYGRCAGRVVRQYAPDVVLSANTPPEAQLQLLRAARRARSSFVFWLQDLYGQGVRRVLRPRSATLAAIAGGWYERLEQRLLRGSDAVVAITEDFLPYTGLDDDDAGLHVIANWAPLGDLPQRPRQNAWAAEHGLNGRLCFLYSGTLGRKHNPSLLLELARRLEGMGDTIVVVISEGEGARWLEDELGRSGAPANLLLLPYQPFNGMAEVLASADVLVGILEPDAGVFSVPSKVLTYLCAGRPLLLAVPHRNLAGRIVNEAGAGIVVEPTDVQAFTEQAVRLARDPELRESCGTRARAYAEDRFDLDDITTRFEAILLKAAGRRRLARRRRSSIPASGDS